MPGVAAKVAMFIIEDELHAEWQEGEYATLEAALGELRTRAELRWDESPNQAPCMSWRTCGRMYVIVEFDASVTPWRELQRVPTLEVAAKGVTWRSGLGS